MAIITKLPDVQNNFPEDLLKEIKKSYSAKPLDAPKALFLATAHDFENLSFNNTPAHFFILNIAKTHRVAIQIIQKIDEIKPAIESAIKFDGKPQQIDLLVFNAHGSNIYMQLPQIYSIYDIKDSDFEGLSPHAEILLASCKTGNGLAQKIADVTHRTVFAPKDDFPFLKTSFTFCEKHGLYEMRSYDAKHQPTAFRFQEGKRPVICDEPSLTYFRDLREFLIQKSNQGHSVAQCDLGCIEEDAGNIDEAKKWFKLAAKQGNSIAQFNLAVIEKKTGNIPEAKKWYLKLAQQGDSVAQCNLGALEEQAGNKDYAKEWYEKAAALGNAKAQCNLGLIAQKAKNLDKAIEWYEKAAALGLSEAYFNLGYIKYETDHKAEAIECYKKAAALGNAKAQFNLGFIAQEANNIDEAIEWYQKAADQGHAKAQRNLGILEEQTGNTDKAIKLYIKAAQQGDSGAKLNLKRIQQKEVNKLIQEVNNRHIEEFI